MPNNHCQGLGGCENREVMTAVCKVQQSSFTLESTGAQHTVLLLSSVYEAGKKQFGKRVENPAF